MSAAQNSSTDDAPKATSQKLSLHLGNLFDRKECSDIKFSINSNALNETIHAHKLILMARSAVFHKMLSAGESPEIDQAVITDVKLYHRFIRFFYTDEIDLADLNWSSIHQLIYLARKYELSYLEEVVNRHTIDRLTTENVCEVLQHFHQYDGNDVTEKCAELIRRHTAGIVHKQSYRNIDAKTLKKILSFDRLAAKETQLFEMILNWAETECERLAIARSSANKRKVSEDAHKLIRFTDMTLEEFRHLFRTNKDFLHKNEMSEISAMLLFKDEATVTSSMRYKPFSLSVPINLTDTYVVYNKNVRAKESIQVSTSKPVKLIGIELRDIVNVTDTSSLSCKFEMDDNHIFYDYTADTNVVHFADGLNLNRDLQYQIYNYVMDPQEYNSKYEVIGSDLNRKTVEVGGITFTYSTSKTFLIKNFLFECVYT